MDNKYLILLIIAILESLIVIFVVMYISKKRTEKTLSLAEPKPQHDSKIECTLYENYLLFTVSDVVITVNRAQEILTDIGEKCSTLNCQKVLLDERTVEKREIPSSEIMKLSAEMADQGLSKIHIAFWCQPHLINKDSELLSMFSYTNEFIIKHFSEQKKAIVWLNTQRKEN